MAIITNEDMITLKQIEKMLKGENVEALYLTKYKQLISKIELHKKQHASKQNEWNKNNKEYHRITNKITYYKKSGNKEKEEYWREKLAEYKGLNK